MSAFTEEATLDMNKIPTDQLERAYWRRRLPPSFRFYLETLSRELLYVRPPNSCAHSAGFLEALLIQRDTELSLLPYESYLEKIMRKRGWEPRTKLTRPYNAPQTRVSPAPAGSPPPTTRTPPPPPPPIPQGSSGRCGRCGGIYCITATSPTPTVQKPAPSPPPRTGAVTPPTTPPPKNNSCARCREIYGSGSMPAAPRPAKLDEEYPKYTIIPIPLEKDAWGKMVRGRGREEEFGELINSRSLSILLDY